MGCGASKTDDDQQQQQQQQQQDRQQQPEKGNEPKQQQRAAENAEDDDRTLVVVGPTAETIPVEQFKPQKPRGAAHVGASAVVSAEERFTTLQLVGFEICTMPVGFETKAADDDWYAGLDDPDKDIAARVAVVADALKRARETPGVRVDDASCLKIFMMPEFFFRGKRGAYNTQDVLGDADSSGALASQLAALVLGPEWADWIFLFGTVVGYKKLPHVYNVAIVQQGGAGSLEAAARARRTIVKQFKSGIDFLEDPKFGGIGENDCRHVLSRDANQALSVAGDPDCLEVDDDGVFVMHGIVFGLEICLDHAQKKLRTLTLPKNGCPDSVTRVQVQLVPSAGMNLREKSVLRRPGLSNVAFLCDGLTQDKARREGAGYGSKTRAQQISADWKATDLQPEGVCDVYAAEEWRGKLAKLFNTAVDFAPRVRAYPPVDVPPASPMY